MRFSWLAIGRPGSGVPPEPEDARAGQGDGFSLPEPGDEVLVADDIAT